VGRFNVACGNDRVAVQGHVTGRSHRDQPDTAPDPDTAPGETVNIRSGNARVGRQANTITGNLTIRM
jgi:hypothetical protein